jgi:hypothetical protein
VNQICCSITRELKATEQGGGFYLQRSTCSIELSYVTEADIAVLVRWHTGARLLGNGQKGWRANGLEDALRRFQEYAPSVSVPYHACVAELLAHLPSGASAGKIVTFHQFVPSESLEGSSQQDPPEAKQAPSGS